MNMKFSSPWKQTLNPSWDGLVHRIWKEIGMNVIIAVAEMGK